MARRSQRVTFAPAAGHRTLLARGLVGFGRRSGGAMRQAVMPELPGTAQARTAAARGRGPCGGPRAALGLTRKLRAVGSGPPRGTGRSRGRRQTQKLCPSTPPPQVAPGLLCCSLGAQRKASLAPLQRGHRKATRGGRQRSFQGPGALALRGEGSGRGMETA